MTVDTTYDLLKPIIDAIDKTVKIKAIVDNTDGTFNLMSCNTLWITINKTIIVAGVEYKVQEIEQDQWIKIKSDVAPIATEFQAYDVHFYNNTTIAQNRLMGVIPNDDDKFPLIWLHEITPNQQPGPLSAIDRIANCELYFLDSRNASDWERPQDEMYVVKPMRRLMKMFVDSLYDTPGIYSEKMQYTTYDHANFGDYQERKGYPQNIFNDKTSGCQFNGQIPFFEIGQCASCC